MLRALVQRTEQGVGFRAFLLSNRPKSLALPAMSAHALHGHSVRRLRMNLAGATGPSPRGVAEGAAAWPTSTAVNASWGDATGEYEGFSVR